MFKRLSANALYQKDKNTKLNDRRIICVLRNNYRSHPSLVQMPSLLFYNNEMKCSTKIGETKYIYYHQLCAYLLYYILDKIQWLSELDILPKRGFPILFEHVEGIPETKENCSRYVTLLLL